MMKKLLCILLSLAATYGSAQSLQIVSTLSDTLSEGNATTENDMESYIVVKNISSNPIDILVKRIDRNYNALTDSNAICWGICFAPDVSVAPSSFKQTLQPGEESGKYDFVGHVYPDMDGIAREGDITYVFFDINNPNDSAAHTVTYKTTQNFSVGESAGQNLVSVFPNPANDNVQVKYDLNRASKGSFELRNIVGSVVYQKNLKSSENSFSLNVSGLSPGVYFYVLKSSEKVLSTKKLVIK